nr:MAG TPA: helix-turn-helix domain protein [Caudoviricetes sp.]
MSIFSKNLKYLREQKKLSQNKLAELSDVNQTTIARWESEEISPSLDNIYDLSLALNVSVADLTGKDLTNTHNINEIRREQLNDLSALDNVLYSKKDKIDSVKNLPIEKQKIIANAVESVLNMIDDESSDQ